MTKFALYVPLQAKPGKEKEVADFLRSAVPLVNAEPGTVTWYAIQEGPSSFAIFDTFDDESGRDAHINGKVAAALMERVKAGDLFAKARNFASSKFWPPNSENRSGRRANHCCRARDLKSAAKNVRRQRSDDDPLHRGECRLDQEIIRHRRHHVFGGHRERGEAPREQSAEGGIDRPRDSNLPGGGTKAVHRRRRRRSPGTASKGSRTAR